MLPSAFAFHFAFVRAKPCVWVSRRRRRRIADSGFTGGCQLSVLCLSVQRAAGRNFFSILDCKPILESSPNYLEVLFFLFRSFYFLRFLTFWLFFSKAKKCKFGWFSDICHVFQIYVMWHIKWKLILWRIQQQKNIWLKMSFWTSFWLFDFF